MRPGPPVTHHLRERDLSRRYSADRQIVDIFERCPAIPADQGSAVAARQGVGNRFGAPGTIEVGLRHFGQEVRPPIKEYLTIWVVESPVWRFAGFNL